MAWKFLLALVWLLTKPELQIKPLSVQYGLGIADHDLEGRLITCEFDSFYLVVSYVPNAGAKLERLVYLFLLLLRDFILICVGMQVHKGLSQDK